MSLFYGRKEYITVLSSIFSARFCG